MFRYPDKPISEISRAGLASLGPGYLAQLKMDGWRCEIEVGEWGPTFTSRHNKPIPISDELRNEFWQSCFRASPHGTILDAEWCARRPGNREESLTVFDVMQIGDNPLWHFSLEDRFQNLLSLFAADSKWVVPYMPPDLLVRRGDFTAFFDTMQRDHPEAEGIVLKRLDSKYIGSYRESALNPGWCKAKWRKGEDGCTTVEQPKGASHGG